MRRSQRLEHFVHAAERTDAYVDVVARLRNRHQPAQGEVRRVGDRRGQSRHFLRCAAGLARLIVDVDLDKYVEWSARGGTKPIERRDELFAVETLQPVEV